MDGPVEFTALMEREYVPVLRVACVIIGDEGIAREVVQEAFTRALLRWRRIARYERPGAWVRLVAVRLATRAAADRARTSERLAVPEVGVEDSYVDHGLTAAIAGLPLTDRAVLVLHYLCDLPVAEVAEIVKARPETVKVRLHRARHRLAMAMEVDDAAPR